MKVRKGSWEENPLTDSEIENFYKKVRKMANDEFGVDGDGSSTLEFILIDRTRCERMHYDPVPYDHRSIQSNKEARRIVLMNLRIASEAVECYFRGEDFREREKK